MRKADDVSFNHCLFVNFYIPFNEYIANARRHHMTSNTEPATIVDKETYVARKLYTLSIKNLHPDPNQPRKFFDVNELQDLANSIKKHGVLQPVLFRKDEDGKLIIVSGERRYQASKLAKADTISAIFTVGNATEIALVENLLRVNLTPIEEAEGLQRLQHEANYSNKELTSVIGKAESTISEILSLNKLTPKIKDEIRNSKDYSRRQLVEVAKGKDTKEINKLFKALAKNNVSRDQLREKRHRAVESVFKSLISGLSAKLNEIELKDLSDENGNDIKHQLCELASLISRKVS